MPLIGSDPCVYTVRRSRCLAGIRGGTLLPDESIVEDSFSKKGE